MLNELLFFVYQKSNLYIPESVCTYYTWYSNTIIYLHINFDMIWMQKRSIFKKWKSKIDSLGRFPEGQSLKISCKIKCVWDKAVQDEKT